MTDTVREEAPAKVNLVLHVGPREANGLHELCSLFASLELHDVITVEPAGDADQVVCPGVDGSNLASAALDAFRGHAGVDLAPLRVTIEKHIPVAGGLAGGSADAAATLRAANRLAGSPLDDAALRELAASLGSDVPSQVRPSHAVVSGTGDVVEPVALPPMWLVLVPSEQGLATSDVYAEADRLGSPRTRLEPGMVRAEASRPVVGLASALENDLQAAALSLRPELAGTIGDLRAEGALGALVSGSGPTVFGVFAERAAADRAAERFEGSIVTGLREQD